MRVTPLSEAGACEQRNRPIEFAGNVLAVTD
jgi:hypothetical protein